MFIAEIFHSLQGEGSLIGVPSIFIRSSGCNLRCSWCDTPYTSWQPEGQHLSLDAILAQVAAYPSRHVVVTGGEPMIAPEIVPLTEQLRARGLHITIETAGTVAAPVACDLMSISPKLANSTPEGPWAAQHERLRYQPAVLRELLAKYDYQLKFVVARPEDLAEIHHIVAETHADRGKVILMPEGVEPGVLRERGAWLAETAKRDGFRFTPRLHIELWGNRREV
ncbi:MAG TPA: 7-carboxy-7-deazaguanine synthase QueE [Bryobacteraceae bacterium]|nr:7-carboxy-7-deazaguanine synthase QueE [Bryobacteraceae bacterium]